MNCEDVIARLSLYVSGDLPERETKSVQAHLDTCPDCASELALNRNALTAVGNIAAADRPKPLAPDFATQVQRRIAAQQVHSRNPFKRDGLWRLLRLAPVGAVAILIAILLFALSRDQWMGGSSDGAGMEGIEARSVIDVEALHAQFGDAVVGPLPIDHWDPSGEAGIYMLMHRPRPDYAPESFSLDYCGESSRLRTFRGNPWIRQRQGRLVARAGSEDNVYIVIIVLPDASGEQRRRLENELRKKYQPHFNRRNGV